MKYENPQLTELLAAEYVMGTLKGRARQRFEGLLQAHPALRVQVREWELRLNRLAGSTPPVSPPAKTWDALQQRLFPSPLRFHWFERLTLWRNLAVGSSLLAAAFAMLLWVTPPIPEAGGPGYVMLINHTGSDQPTWLVSTSAKMGQVYVKNMKAMDMPEDIHCLLWVQPKGSKHFYALGVLPDKGGDRVLKVDKRMRSMLPDSKLLVTVEDLSGAMPAQPSNPPQYQGKWMPLAEI